MKIIKRKDGRFQTQVRYKDKLKYFYAKTHKECEEKALKFLKEFDETIEPSKITFEEWCEEWLETFTTNLKQKTLKSYTSVLYSKIIPEIGYKNVQSITKMDIQIIVNKLSERLSPKSVRNAIGVLHRVLEDAVDNNIIRKNPAGNVNMPKKRKPQLEYLEEEEISEFIREAESDEYFDFLMMLLGTGMRVNELTGLQWKHVDLRRGIINIEQQLYNNNPIILSLPKHDRKREIPITGKIKGILEKLKDEDSDSFVFKHSDGRPFNHVTIRKHFNKIVKKIGKEELRLHDLRHTYTVLALKAGVNPKIVSEILGHYSVQFTLDVYSYVMKSQYTETVNKIDKEFDKYY